MTCGPGKPRQHPHALSPAELQRHQRDRERRSHGRYAPLASGDAERRSANRMNSDALLDLTAPAVARRRFDIASRWLMVTTTLAIARQDAGIAGCLSSSSLAQQQWLTAKPDARIAVVRVTGCLHSQHLDPGGESGVSVIAFQPKAPGAGKGLSRNQ